MSAASARWLVACDLDQTLIYSRRAFRLPPGAREPELRLVEVYNGAPAGFMTARAADLLHQLASAAELVPVTTRTIEQYRRVDLGVRTRYAVAANGGILLVDGEPDRSWEHLVRQRLAETGRPLPEVRRLAEQIADPSWVRTLRVADDYFVYLVAHERGLIPDLTDLEAELLGAGWTLSIQGRKVYLVPAALTKQAALAEVAERCRLDRTVAAGDSLLDLGLLEAADAAVRPAHGELHDARWMRPHLRVTGSPGLLGGEQVVQTLLAVTGVTVVAG
jgi:hydroxymethylpyrimidine pyrophosphatase-like HAD family hydrolase